VIAVVDYEAGNLHSVSKALAQAGLEAVVTADAAVVEAADGVVLPGVGAFPDCMARLRQRGLVEPLKRFLASGRPFLGICLGLQVLFDCGEEGDGCAGLGVLPGRVVRLRAPGLKVPQMGWNALRLRRPSPLFEGVPEGSYVYFVHSYHAVPADPADLLATVDYREEVTAAVQRGSVFAVQFHPEKSSAVGLRVLANFGGLVEGAALRTARSGPRRVGGVP
jgi:glutamine amidotransferase